MQNWEILDNYNFCDESNQTKDEDILSALLGEYELDTNFMDRKINMQLEEINKHIKGVNQERVDILNSFPSCSLAIIKSLTRNDNMNEENIDIDQMSLSSNGVNSDNDSPLFESRASMDIQSLTDSPGTMNMSDFL